MERPREKNRNALLHGIQTLPTYEAPAQIWANIEAHLDQQTKLQTAIQELPQYAPPIRVWDQIEQSMDQKGRVVPLRSRLQVSRYQWWMAAASVGGLIFFACWLVLSDPTATTTFAYSEEVLAAPATNIDWETEDQTINLVLQQVNRSPVADATAVTRLKLEFDELTEARSEVESILKRYGEDEGLLKEVARIERERSKVIKQLATWI